MLEEKIKRTIRDVPNFPKEGILFKDITPVLSDSKLSIKVADAFFQYWKGKNIEGVAGIESRGFLFGAKLAWMLGVPFIPIRKSGKLPYETYKQSYDLEYGSAEIEMHIDAVKKYQRILIHDDLLATGGSASATSQLIEKAGGVVSGYSFIVELAFLGGKSRLEKFHSEIQSLTIY